MSLLPARLAYKGEMPSSSIEPVDLLDLKLLPAWVKESADARQYEHYEGEERSKRGPGGRDDSRSFRKPRVSRGFDKKRDGDRGKGPRRPQDRPASAELRRGKHQQDRPRKDRPAPDQPRTFQPKPLEIEIKFLPHPPALESVTAQIKSGSVAYSLFALARLFLEKPERYDVQLKTKPEVPLYRLGENGALSSDREFLERSAFRLAQPDFYKIDITESEPIKGNFTNVARCKLSGTLFGPTNHHAYQAQLRNLFEQRFSRRMSFADYQRQVEIISDPAAVEKWKEEARKITTFTTLHEDPPVTFSSVTDAEKHFREKHLPELVHKVAEVTVDGVESRRMADRALHRAVEDAWVRETRSPSQMMPELAARLREAGLHIFRHRKGMLFVSSIRARALAREGKTLSSTVSAILETVSASPRINRKDLAEKVIVDPSTTLRTSLAEGAAESRKLALASDLHWLINEGYVIEFNDGSLDLPRAKQPKSEKKVVEAAAAAVETEPVKETNVETVAGSAEFQPAN